MRGSLRSRGRNSWQIQVYVGMGPDGKPRRHYETIHGRKADVQRRLTELLSSLDKGVYVPPGRLTLAQHLSNWLNSYVQSNCSQATKEAYQNIVYKHLMPALGHHRLKNLHPQQIQSYYGGASEKLSKKSVLQHHRVLSEALKYACRQGYMGSNPCELVDPPRPQKKIMRTLTPGELEVLLSHAASNKFYPPIYTAINTGLRQAELLGLRWRDIDLTYSSISISQVLYKRRGICQFKQPKTAHSRRRVAMTPKLALFLRDYKADQESMFWQLGQPLTPDDLVFCSIEKKPLDPSVLTHNFSRIVKKSGLENIRFHDLRHTFASLMLLRGAKPKVIQEALGHSSVAFTLDTYAHILENMQKDAMISLDEIMPPGIRKNNGNLTSNS